MISERVSELLRDIFQEVPNPAVHQRVKVDPEAHLLSLLKEIKEDLSGDKKHRVPLYFTVQRASYGSSVNEARGELEGLHESVA